MKTKKYKTKKYKTKKYKTKKYKKNAKGVIEAKCAKIMGQCFRCFDNKELFFDNPSYAFNKQDKIFQDINPFKTQDTFKKKPNLNRQSRFKLPKTNDAKKGRELANEILNIKK